MFITKEKFLTYEAVKEEGVTNLLKIVELAYYYYNENLEKDEILEIRKNYSKYYEKYINKNRKRIRKG